MTVERWNTAAEETVSPLLGSPSYCWLVTAVGHEVTMEIRNK